MTRARIDCDIAVEAGPWPEGSDAWVNDAVAAVCERLALNVREGAELAVLLTDNADQQTLNARWRGKDTPTNVLSFPAIEAEAGVPPVLSGHIGDISLAYETVSDEAEAERIPLAHHVTHLVVHGLLHILGYDHIRDDQAARMESLETEILGGMGIADPYETTLTGTP